MKPYYQIVLTFEDVFPNFPSPINIIHHPPPPPKCRDMNTKDARIFKIVLFVLLCRHMHRHLKKLGERNCDM